MLVYPILKCGDSFLPTIEEIYLKRDKALEAAKKKNAEKDEDDESWWTVGQRIVIE